MIKKQLKIGMVSKSIHWLIALLMIALLAVGWIMVELDYFSAYYYTAPALHYSLGILLFLIVLFKIIWQLLKPLPDYNSNFKKFEIYAAKFVHSILLFGMMFMPISGYIIITAGNSDVSVFGLVDMPVFFQANDVIRDLATDFHTYFSFILVALIGLHILAALKHRFIDKIITDRNMWPK